MYVVDLKLIEFQLNFTEFQLKFKGEGHFGAAVSAPPTRRRRFGAGQLGAVPFRRRTIRRHFLIFFYFSNYEEKTMKQAIS